MVVQEAKKSITAAGSKKTFLNKTNDIMAAVKRLQSYMVRLMVGIICRKFTAKKSLTLLSQYFA
jgi:hypothetical protein